MLYVTYIWLIFMVNVGKYTIHGWYGLVVGSFADFFIFSLLFEASVLVSICFRI